MTALDLAMLRATEIDNINGHPFQLAQSVCHTCIACQLVRDCVLSFSVILCVPLCVNTAFHSESLSLYNSKSISFYQVDLKVLLVDQDDPDSKQKEFSIHQF